jgi:hypothetical protein
MFAADDVLAQGGSTAQISGTVRDESGGLVPGADVTATQADTGVTQCRHGRQRRLCAVEPAHRAVPARGQAFWISFLLADRHRPAGERAAGDRCATRPWRSHRGTDKTPLQAPIVTVNSQTFGQILEAADPRIMQFAVKFGF